MKMIVLLGAVLLVACGSTDAAPRCEPGRVQSCPCSSGAQGTQECGLGGAWSVCMCSSGDAGADSSADVSDTRADASRSDVAATDAALVDGAPAPRLYQGCDLGGDCGAGLTCVAVPGLVRDAGAGRGVCTSSCSTSAECAAGALCVMGACQVECPTGEDRECGAWGTSCLVSSVVVDGSRSPARTVTAYCAP